MTQSTFQLKQNVVFEEDVIKEIYELSKGISYYMQILAYSCFEETDKVTMNDFKGILILLRHFSST